MYTVAKNTKTISFALMAIGLIALIFGFSTDSHRAWPSLMINNYFFLAIGAFAIFFVAACASSTHAMIDAFNYIKWGKARAVLYYLKWHNFRYYYFWKWWLS